MPLNIINPNIVLDKMMLTTDKKSDLSSQKSFKAQQNPGSDKKEIFTVNHHVVNITFHPSLSKESQVCKNVLSEEMVSSSSEYFILGTLSYFLLPDILIILRDKILRFFIKTYFS